MPKLMAESEKKGSVSDDVRCYTSFCVSKPPLSFSDPPAIPKALSLHLKLNE